MDKGIRFAVSLGFAFVTFRFADALLMDLANAGITAVILGLSIYGLLGILGARRP